MRKIRIFAHVSIDGVVSPGGPGVDPDYANGGWMVPFRTPAGAAAVTEIYGTTFDLLLGRRTYDLWAVFWPKAPSSPIADGLNAATKYVATHRPEGLGWGPAIALGADVMGEVGRIKAGDGPDLVVSGSTTLTSGLLEGGLVDEVVLVTYPILVGRGKRFFGDEADPRELALVGSMATPSGVLINSYRHVGSLRARFPAAATG